MIFDWLLKRRVECCVNDIDCWMVNNGLKLNQDKTVLVLRSSKFRSRPSLEFIQVGDEKNQPKSSARNLGVIIDQCLDLTDHVKKIGVSCHYHLRNIAKIRKYLSEKTSEILEHAFISSKLDNCNSLLYGLPKRLLNRLRYIQNTAARIVTLSKRFLCYSNIPRLLRSSSQNFLAVPRSRLKTYGDRAFSAVAPRLWNQLHPELRGVTSVDQLRTHLKTYLFKLPYDVWF